MTTVLLWGDRWWLPHQKLPVPFADFSQAADMLAAAWPGHGQALRIIYQPDEFTTVAAPCPNGNRSTLILALAEEHPVLLHPGHVWSYEPILGTGEGFNTLLHFETRPALFGLVQRLEEHGFNVASVWPLATWLTALPPELSDSGAMTLVALHADRFCVYRHSPAGVRAVRTGQGASAMATVAEQLQEVFSQSAGEFVLFVTTDDALFDALNERLTPARNQVVGWFTIGEALAKAAPLPARHPAQLLPPVPRVTASRVITVASILFLAVAGATVASEVRGYWAGRTDAAERDAQKQALRVEVARLRANAGEITASRATVAQAGTKPPCGVLLRELGGVPPEVALTMLRVTPEGFVLAAGIKPGGNQTADAWTARAGRPGLPWQLQKKETTADGVVRLAGVFSR